MTRDSLTVLFKNDDEFVCDYTKFHPEVNSGLDNIVDDNWNKIKDLKHVEKDYGYFAVDTKTDIIPWIVGFYVKPENRKNNTLIEDIKNEGSFLVCVTNNNTRAIKFIEKFCKVVKKDEVKTVFYYIKERGNLCR